MNEDWGYALIVMGEEANVTDQHVPSITEDTEKSDGLRRGARMRRETREDHGPDPRGEPLGENQRVKVRGRPACYPGAVQAGARTTGPLLTGLDRPSVCDW